MVEGKHDGRYKSGIQMKVSGINTFKREICGELGEEFWNKLTEDLILPDMETEAQCQCCNMKAFMEKFDSMTDPETINRILARERHGVTPSQSAWARVEFLKVGDLDKFLEGHLQKELAAFEKMNAEGKDFYGEEITDDVIWIYQTESHDTGAGTKRKEVVHAGFPCEHEGISERFRGAHEALLCLPLSVCEGIHPV